MGTFECLAGLACLAGAAGRAETAARLVGAAHTLRDATGHRAGHLEPTGWEEAAGGQLADAMETGRALPIDAVVAEALAVAEAITGSWPGSAVCR